MNIFRNGFKVRFHESEYFGKLVEYQYQYINIKNIFLKKLRIFSPAKLKKKIFAPGNYHPIKVPTH